MSKTSSGKGRETRGGAVAPVGEDERGREALYRPCEMAAIRLGISRGREAGRHTMRIHGQMYLGVGPPFVSPRASVPPRALVVVVLHAGRVHHQPLEVRGVDQNLQQALPAAPVPPAAEAPVRVLSVAAVRWQVVPVGPVLRTQNTAFMNRRLSSAIPPAGPSGQAAGLLSGSKSGRLCRDGDRRPLPCPLFPQGFMPP